ncbi:MAG: hypothetical protein ACTSO9_12445 [Candidatus Helarchaeota archaeon]
MGIWSRLKEFFSKKSLETFKEIEIEFQKLQKKCNSEIIAIIGTSGKPKGLPLVFVSDEKIDLRRYSANIAELMAPLRKISGKEEIKEFIVCYDVSRIYFKPIMEDISFFALVKDKNDITTLRQWVNSKISELREVFPSKN